MTALMVDVKEWTFDRTYTDAPMPVPLPWDGTGDVTWHKLRVRTFQRCEQARRNRMLLARDAAGRQLYKLTDGGQVKRTFELSSSRKRRVIERDQGACVWCGSARRLEVDHIVRYIDGGGNDESNLRTLCHSCHTKRGGRA